MTDRLPDSVIEKMVKGYYSRNGGDSFNRMKAALRAAEAQGYKLIYVRPDTIGGREAAPSVGNGDDK